MNRRYVAALSAGILSVVFAASALAQTAAPQAPAAAPAAAPVKPEAIPAKIALIAFEQAVFATNEGQKTVQDVQKKYEPTRTKIEGEGAEVDNLKKQLQAATTISDEERASRVRTIDTKEKQLNLDGENASAAYQQDLQTAYAGVATKVSETMRKYVQANGYTLVIDVSGQQSPVMWADQKTDITRAIVDAYNASSGVAAPAPSAPSASRPAAPRATPRSAPPATAPKK